MPVLSDKIPRRRFIVKNAVLSFRRLLILLTMTVVTAAAHVVATAIAMQRILIRKNNQSFANE